MKTYTNKRKDEAGFTLVELAVVMIIIGLLIGGALKGQELIQSARITGIAKDLEGYEAATLTFRDMKGSIPGDLENSQQRLANCNAGTVCAVGTPAGIGNGHLEQTPAVAHNDAEVRGFFTQLAAVDLIEGVDPAEVAANATGEFAWGKVFPDSSVGGGFTVGYAPNPGGTPAELAGANPDTPRRGHYFVLKAIPDSPANAAAPNGVTLIASDAERIDAKFDDGNPVQGAVLGVEANAGDCYQTAGQNDFYNSSNPNVACSLYIRSF